MSHAYRHADVLVLECPFTETVVADAGRYHVSVLWPWLALDPQAEGISWNGHMALPTPAAQEREIFRTEPSVTTLRAGDTCRVGIPATVVHVQSVKHFDPPLVTGMLPRPATYLDVLPQGETHDPELEDQGFAIDPDQGGPIRITLLYRPYAFLEPGDEVADRSGRAWRFDAAWTLHAFDGEAPGTPNWPLTLLSRQGEPTPEEAASVARATASGSHANAWEQWAGLSGSRPRR
ncbi:hypothetical protein ACGFW5_22650 [Streptomyces sp. NPDC048416]|uniref:hypothetical protein n=1 Tax=Streptomyces sp. NPDC048416 TaxID=3365546 RepID=UPI003718B8DC